MSTSSSSVSWRSSSRATCFSLWCSCECCRRFPVVSLLSERLVKLFCRYAILVRSVFCICSRYSLSPLGSWRAECVIWGNVANWSCQRSLACAASSCRFRRAISWFCLATCSRSSTMIRACCAWIWSILLFVVCNVAATPAHVSS